MSNSAVPYLVASKVGVGERVGTTGVSGGVQAVKKRKRRGRKYLNFIAVIIFRKFPLEIHAKIK
jgi:hypothetical protein